MCVYLFRNPKFVRSCEGYHVPWLFLSTLMNFNFNPLTYDFTSSIPDVFEMSDFQDSSVYLAIYLNRSQSPVFSTTLYAYGGKASIYDLRSIIENYMEAKQLVHATCSFRMQVDRTDYTLGEFTLIYCKLQMLRTNCELFLQSHFLTTHAVRLVRMAFILFCDTWFFQMKRASVPRSMLSNARTRTRPKRSLYLILPLQPNSLVYVTRKSSRRNFWTTCPKG